MPAASAPRVVYWETAWSDEFRRGPFTLGEAQLDELWRVLHEVDPAALRRWARRPDGALRLPDGVVHAFAFGLLGAADGYAAAIAYIRAEHYEIFGPLHVDEPFYVLHGADLVGVVDDTAGLVEYRSRVETVGGRPVSQVTVSGVLQRRPRPASGGRLGSA